MIELQYALPEEFRKEVVKLGLRQQYRCAHCGRVYHIMDEQTEFACVECGCTRVTYSY